ncbi:TPA: hypothetical protein ACKP0L_003616 [Pseudomonas putida]|nr:hypothetical protein [Pseudomonas fluorescens]
MKESFMQLKALNSSRVKDLIDNKKMLYSYIFGEALNYTIQHYEVHKDSSLMLVLINLFTDRNCKLLVVDYLGERLGVKCSVKDDVMKISKSDRVANPKASLKVRLEQFTANGFKVDLPKKINTTAKKEKKSLPKRIDMLDSWARLPGSYGAGKRQ